MSKGTGEGRRRFVGAGNAPGDVAALETVIAARWLDPEGSAEAPLAVAGALGALPS
jgi:hypothetical protein